VSCRFCCDWPSDESDHEWARVYLALRKLATATARPTEEMQQLYSLEGVLDRLGRSPHANRFALKGGVLPAAYDTRRPTRDVDLAGIHVPGDLAEIHRIVQDVVGVAVDDGLTFDAGTTTVEPIRDDEGYGGARVKVRCSLSTAELHLHVDVNIGDPLWPPPELVDVPRVLGGSPLRLRGYRIELVLAEKIVTAMQRGTANTRWRDFVDIANLAGCEIERDALAESIRRVSTHRGVPIQQLSEILEGFARLAQPRWVAGRRKQHLSTTTPEAFAALLDDVLSFVDPVLSEMARGPRKGP